MFAQASQVGANPSLSQAEMVMNLLITNGICTWMWSNREGRGTTSEAQAHAQYAAGRHSLPPPPIITAPYIAPEEAMVTCTFSDNRVECLTVTEMRRYLWAEADALRARRSNQATDY